MNPKKTFLKHFALFLVPALLFIAFLFIRPLDKPHAYFFCNNDCYNKGTWIRDRAVVNPARVDVAFIGSSRTSLGIMESAMEDTFKAKGLNLNVANMGYCRWGRNMEYTTAKLLFQHKRPKYLVLELHEEEERLGHVDFGYVADSKDVLFPVLFFDQHYFSDLLKAFEVRFDIFKHELFRNEVPVAISKDLHGYIHFTGTINPAELDEMLQKDRASKKYPDTKIEAYINKQFPLAYVQKMITMAQAANCKMVFLYMPGYCSLPPAPGAFDYYKHYGPVLITPTYITTAKQNWRDGNHYNDSGAQKLSGWVARQIALFY